MAATAVQKHHVETTLSYFKPNADGSPPGPAYMARPQTFERPNEVHNVIIQDAAGDEESFGLDSHGFMWAQHTSVEKDFVDNERIKDLYYKDVEHLIKEKTGASRVFVFDHTIRRPIDRDAAGKPKYGIPPSPVVHIDQSYEAALSRVPFHLPEDANKLIKCRVQIINVWRPIKTVKKDPLAVAQSQSVPESDLVPIPVVYDQGNRKGATMQVRYREGHQWYYKSYQRPDEALLIKCFDNRAGAQSAKKYEQRAKRVPHSSFTLPGTEDEDCRESIEVRCLVFHEYDVEQTQGDL